MVRISVLVSGGGTNLQAVIDNIENGLIENAEIVQVLSSREDAFALKRAAKAGIKGRVVKGEELFSALEEEKTDLIVLAGYMKILPPAIIEKYRKRIINIHPSLIPKYCGKGFYGRRVHEAVIAAGEATSGATVHFVDEGVDTGEIIIQRAVPVEEGDTADTLAARVLKTEHLILTQAIKQVVAELEKGGNKWAE